MVDAVLWLIVFGVFLAALVWWRIRENRFLKKNTKDTARPQIRLEIEAEKAEIQRRKKAFEDSLKKWGS